MNLTQSKRSKQPAPLYPCASASCTGGPFMAFELHWSGSDTDEWAWCCLDCSSTPGLERGETLRSFLADEHAREALP